MGSDVLWLKTNYDLAQTKMLRNFEIFIEFIIPSA